MCTISLVRCNDDKFKGPRYSPSFEVWYIPSKPICYLLRSKFGYLSIGRYGSSIFVLSVICLISVLAISATPLCSFFGILRLSFSVILMRITLPHSSVQGTRPSLQANSFMSLTPREVEGWSSRMGSRGTICRVWVLSPRGISQKFWWNCGIRCLFVQILYRPMRTFWLNILQSFFPGLLLSFSVDLCK